jgi:hypothetical protein
MAEVLVSFDDPVTDETGQYRARAIGRLCADKMWEGWLEFVPLDGQSDVVVGGVESRQPEREHLVYWATGLTPVFLDGALRRARNPVTVRVKPIELPYSSAPAARVARRRVAASGPEPVLDPFDIASHSPDQLRQSLGALNRPRLLNIIAAYDLNSPGENVGWMSDAQLIHFIVTAAAAHVRAR